MKRYAITITYKCNWNCSYCAIRNKYDYKPNMTHEDVIKKIGLIENGSEVTIFGGEPGLVERDKLEMYIKLLKEKQCRLLLETNGTFLYNYMDLVDNFDYITYHCSCELQDEIYRTELKNIKYMIIVHDENVIRLETYLDKNKDIKFYIVEATYPHEDMNGPRLSPQNKNYIMIHFYNRMTKESIDRMINGKNLDEIEFLT